MVCAFNIASCGSIGVEWFGNAADCNYGIENHQRLYSHTQTNTSTWQNPFYEMSKTVNSNMLQRYCVKSFSSRSLKLISYIRKSGFGTPAEDGCFLPEGCRNPFFLSLGFLCRMCLGLTRWFICVYVARFLSNNSSAIVTPSSTLMADRQTDRQTETHGQTDEEIEDGERDGKRNKDSKN